MKKSTTIITLLLLCAASLFAQAPEKFTYQAVVRNASNSLVVNASVGVRVSVLQGSASGNAVYSESHMATTNANGLVTVNIGDGSVLHGTFADIDWSDGPYFLKTDIDPNGGNDYSIMSTQQLMSVPYALYAKEAGNIPTVPANVSAFTNDAGYITEQDIPEIPTVPTNVSAFINDAGYITMDSIPEIPTVPTNVSAFANDAGYITSDDIPSTTVPTNVSAFVNDAGYITMDSVPSVPTNVSAFTNDAGYLTGYTETDPQFSAWDKDYNDLINRPTIPSVPTNVSEFTNDAGYITMDSIPEIPTVPTNVSAFANDAGYITSNDIPATNVPTNISAFNNDAGYITAEQMPASMSGTQTGDIMYWDATTATWIMMPAGGAGQVLTMENGVPVWANLPDHITMNLPPTVTTSAPLEVTQSSALCGGIVTSDGSVQLTACGVCWGTHHFPTIADAHTENDLSVSAFTSHITGLAHHTTYYVRAYATNSIGTTYGAEMTFTTADIPSGSVTMPDPCSADTNTIWHPTLGPGSTLCAGTDSVELTLNNYQYGSIQWQYSSDTVSWFNIPGAIDTLLVYKPDQTQYVRASVSTANCPPEYSPVRLLLKTPSAYAGISRTANVGDTVRLQANMEEDATGSWQILQGTGGFLSNPNEDYTKFFGTDTLYRVRWTLTNNCGSSSDDISVRYVQTTVSDKIVMVDTTDIIFSDSAQMAQGYYVISFSDPNIVIGDSTILISLINGGFLRMVDSWSMADDSTYAMYTSQATLYDILESGVIQFDAIYGENEVDSMEQNTSSAQELMYLDHIPTRDELRLNPELSRDGKVYMLGMELEGEDGSRVSLMPGRSSQGGMRGDGITITNETEFNEVKWNKVKAFPDLGITLDNVNFNWDIKPTVEYDWDKRRLKFGIYHATLKMSVDLVSDFTLAHVDYTPVEYDIIKGTVKFYVPAGGVVIPFSLDYGIKFKIDGSLDISDTMRHRFTASAIITRGVRYYVKSNKYELDTITRGSSSIETISDNAVGSVDLGASIAVYLNFKLLTLAGPRIQGGYKAKIKYCHSLLGNNTGWQGKLTSDLFVKLDLKGAKIIDPLIPENWSKEWTFLHKERVFPDTMYLYRGNNQTISNTQASNIVKVKVEGSGGKPIHNARVYFQPKDGGTVSSNFALTDQNGIAQTVWSPSPSSAIHQLYAYAYDCEQNPIKGAPVVFTAYEYAGCTSSTLNLRYLLTGNTLTLQASGGEPPYTYSVDGEHFVPLSELPPLSALASYVLSVKDTNGCIRSITYSTPANTNCDWSDLDMDAEFSNGALILQGTGGTPPYRYSLGGISYSTNNVFPSLSPGVYTAYVMDATDCDYNRSITVEDDDILDLTSYNSQPCAGTTTVTDYDGNVYPTIQIGQQCWMKENLRTTHYADGEIIPIGSACYYPNGNAGNRAQYGLLYTWYAATRNTSSGSNPSGVRGACPYGWHVPSDAEWSQLLSQPQLMVCPAKALATKFGWNISTTPCSPGNENWYNNGSGFNAAPAGLYNSGYGDFGSVAWFWSATEDYYGINRAWNRNLSYDGTGVGRDGNGYQARAYSVRCLRD